MYTLFDSVLNYMSLYMYDYTSDFLLFFHLM